MHDTSRYRERYWGFRQVFESESFIADAREVIKTPPEQFTQALETVSAAGGFLDEAGLAGKLTSIEIPAQRNALRNFISAFASWRASALSIKDTEGVLARIHLQLAEALSEQSFATGEEATLAERVKAIWNAPFPAVDLAIKASRLVTEVGSQVDKISLVCDLRPIFDESRSTVQGLVPLTTLKIVSHGEDAVHPDTFEVQLTEKELEELHEKVTLARTKVRSLKGFVAKAGVALPNSLMTKPEAEE
jgi:hypothetical protein